MKSAILLIRPQQWVKNFFVFLPLFFDRHLLDAGYLVPAIVVFFAFSFVASSIYCFNDVWDAELDRLHPKKCKRPVASGKISPTVAYTIMGGLLVFAFAGVAVFFSADRQVMTGVIVVLASYFVLNILYCVKLKQIALIDVFIISVGFVLRVVVGGIAAGIYISHWIILMTFLLALFLAFAKRRDDVVMYEKTGLVARKNVVRYNVQFMNQVISIVATVTMVCYIMYTVSPEVVERYSSNYLYLSAVWVLLGILRYLQLTIVDLKSGSPTNVLLRDRFIHFCIVCWILTFVVIIYV